MKWNNEAEHFSGQILASVFTLNTTLYQKNTEEVFEAEDILPVHW